MLLLVLLEISIELPEFLGSDLKELSDFFLFEVWVFEVLMNLWASFGFIKVNIEGQENSKAPMTSKVLSAMKLFKVVVPAIAPKI